MAGRKKDETAPVSARTLQRRAKLEQKIAQAARTAAAAPAKTKPKRKPAKRVNAVPVEKFVDRRTPEVKAIDEKLTARLLTLIDTAPPTIEALQQLLNLRHTYGFSI